MQSYDSYRTSLAGALAALSVTDGSGAPVGTEAGFERWTHWTAELRRQRRTNYFVGNGASATMASHMAADGAKNAGFRALAFNDAGLLTAAGNDNGFDETFAIPLRRFGEPGDMLTTISSSGNSPNIVRAIGAAREFGLRIVTLSGMKPDNRSRQMGDLNFYIPAQTYGLVESAHATVLHCWLDQVLATAGNQ